MQIIQTQLGNNIHPLRIISISSLSNTHRLGLIKESNFLHSQNNFISSIQRKSPLITSSEFFLSQEQEQLIEPLTSWDNPDVNSEFSLIELDPLDSIDSEQDNNFNNSELVKGSDRQILPNIIEANTSIEKKAGGRRQRAGGKNLEGDSDPHQISATVSEITVRDSNPRPVRSQQRAGDSIPPASCPLPSASIVDISPETNIQTKSKSKKTNKSQQASKSKTKKPVKSSAAKNIVEPSGESNIPISPKLIASNEPPLAEVNSEMPTLQQDFTLNNTISNITPSITAYTLPNIEEEATLFSNIPNEEQEIIADLPSILPNVEPSISEKSLPLQQKTKLDDDTSKLSANSPKELTLPPHIDETFLPSSNAKKNKLKIITEASQAVDIPDIPVISTPLQPDIEIIQPSEKIEISDISVNPTPLQPDIEIIQPSEKVEISDISVSPTPLQPDIEIIKLSEKVEISNISANPTPLQPDIEIIQLSEKVEISDISANQTLLQPDIEIYELPSQVDNQSADSLTNFIQKKELSPISKPPLHQEEPPNKNNSSEAITAIESDLILESSTTDFDIAHFVADNSPENTPLSSTVTSDGVENTGVADSSTPITPISVVKNPSESLASTPVQLTVTSANTEDTPSLFSNSDNNELELLVNSESQSAVGVNVSDISANVTSLQRHNNLENTITESRENQPILAPPEIFEASKVNAILPEIIEASAVNPTSPEIFEASKVNAILPEIIEAPVVNPTSPEIIEAPAAKPTLPEIFEPLAVNAIFPEIVEAPTVKPTLPEIVEAPAVNPRSPEIFEAPKLSDVSSSIAEISNISPKIVENEQTIQSELSFGVTNPEISTFIDTSNNRDIPEKTTSPSNQVNTPPEIEQNTTIKNLVAPKGYATGGHVTESHIQNEQQIAPSDTVPAMLTPGEFVINTRDAQKNLPLLQHLNTGGTPQDIILPSLQIPNSQEPEQKISPETSTKVDSFTDTSLHLKKFDNQSPQKSNSLIPSSLELNVGKQKLSILNYPQITSVENKTKHVGETSPQYSSPPLIFRKTNSTTNTPSQWSETPSQWSSVEELFNGNDDKITSFFPGGESNNQNYELSRISTSSESSQIFAKHLPAPRGFADGGEVTPSDISVNTQSITETVESTSAKDEEHNKDNTADIEALAREIYSRLRQRLEIERERQGGYSGRLSW
jgi:hypothetical protein